MIICVHLSLKFIMVPKMESYEKIGLRNKIKLAKGRV